MGSDDSQVLSKVGQCLYRNGHGTYFAIVKVAGKQFKRSLKTQDRALADRKLDKFKKKAERLRGATAEKTLTFDDLKARWLASIKPELKPNSYNRRVTALKALTPFFKGERVRSISLQHIEQWKIKRGADLAPRTWNIEIETLQMMLDYAMNDLRILLENPAREVNRREFKKTKKGEEHFPTKERFGLLVNELRSGHKATGAAADFVEFLGYSGCRQTEAANVRWIDIEFEKDGRLHVTGGEMGTKNHKTRMIPLFAPLRRLLLGMKQARPDAQPQDFVFQIKDARLQINRACARLGFPRYGNHSMRHFFCSNAIEAGIDFKVIAEWLGHQDGGVLVAQTYGHLRAEHSKAMAKKMTFDVVS